MALRREVQIHYRPQIPMLTDSKSSIAAIQRRPKGSEVGYQLIHACQHQLSNSSTPLWIKSHPEKYSKEFTPQQHGIFLADIYADGSDDPCSHSFTIPSSELSLLRNGSRLILTQGSELVVQDLRYIAANHHFHQYIQQRNQQSRNLYGNWTHTTGKLAQELWRVSKLTPNRLGSAQRFCWDKYYHLSHPSLDPDQPCHHCDALGGLDHTIRFCSTPTLLQHRLAVFSALDGAILSMIHQNQLFDICNFLRDVALRHTSGIRIWTGLWNEDIQQLLNDFLQRRGLTRSTLIQLRPSIIHFLQIFTDSLPTFWKIWLQFILPQEPTLLSAFPALNNPYRFYQSTIPTYLGNYHSKQAATTGKRKRPPTSGSNTIAPLIPRPTTLISSIFAPTNPQPPIPTPIPPLSNILLFSTVPSKKRPRNSSRPPPGPTPIPPRNSILHHFPRTTHHSHPTISTSSAISLPPATTTLPSSLSPHSLTSDPRPHSAHAPARAGIG